MEKLAFVFGLLVIARIPIAASAVEPGRKIDAQAGYVDAGVGVVDITPTEPVALAGSPSPLKSSSVGARLYVRALVLSGGGQKVAIVTLDTLKYPVEHVVRARRQIEKTTGIRASNVIICASHTHRGPLWSYYKDQLVTPIAEAVATAARDLSPCRLGVSEGKAEGVSECRRVIKDGKAWNRWQLAPEEADKYPAEGPADPEFIVLSAIGKDGRHKAVVHNFACHAANARDLAISADYPGEVQKYVQDRLGYEAPVLFLTGACGDVNPVYRARRDLFAERLGGGIVRCLGQLELIAKPSLAMESREVQMPGREHPELKEAEIARNWPKQFAHYRKAFNDMKQMEKPAYQCFFTGIRIGNDFAIVTNPNELFCEIGMSIKRQSPFRHTMVAEQTNGAHGYVPTAKAFEGGSYETWFGEHSYLTARAGEIIEKESLDILNRLKHAEWSRFRGPNGTGISDATSVPVRWTDKDYNWKVELPGVGHSSPVVWGKRVFVTCGDSQTAKRKAICLDTATGRTLWHRDYPSRTYRQHGDNCYATATPAVDGNGVVLVWTTPEQFLVLALDLDGREVWRRDLGPFVSIQGSGSSPILFEDLVVVVNDQEDTNLLPGRRTNPPGPIGKSFLAALDRKTGQVRWQTDRPTSFAGYSTPCVYQAEGGRPSLIFTNTANGISAVDPATGKVTWEFGKQFLDRAISSPVVAPGLVIAGHGAGIRAQRYIAVRPGEQGKPPFPVYELNRAIPLVPTPLVKDGRLFLWTDDGVVSCLRLANGEPIWRERVGGSYYGSPVWVDNRLYCISRTGEVVVVAAADKFEVLARVPLGEPSYATPAVAGGVMYLRTRSHVFSLGGGERRQPGDKQEK